MFAENLRKLRKERGWLQKELAKEMGVSLDTVSQWERGLRMPEMLTVMEICKLFQVSVGELFDNPLEPSHSDGGLLPENLLENELIRRAVELAILELRSKYPQKSNHEVKALLISIADEILEEMRNDPHA